MLDLTCIGAAGVDYLIDGDPRFSRDIDVVVQAGNFPRVVK
jgi:hypothetical protein